MSFTHVICRGIDEWEDLWLQNNATMHTLKLIQIQSDSIINNIEFFLYYLII